VKALVLIAALAACGPKSQFRLSSDENNTFELGRSLQMRKLPAQPAPVNTTGQPRLFALTTAAGANKTIVAYDLASGNVMWKVDAEVNSRIVVGGDFVCAYEGKQLVGRDQARGQPKWRISIDGTFVGAAADRDRVYIVQKTGSKWWLSGHDGSSGREIWKVDSTGELGGPAAQGGLIYVPFLRQWLSIVDGSSGKQMTRLRGIDQDITMLRVTSRAAYYGSKQGMFELDARSASGKRTDATFGQVKLPTQLDGTTYGREVYDPVQMSYTAAERKRVLWTSTPVENGGMKLGGDGYVVHYFRYVFGFDLAGGLRWAYSHPRVELVASSHTGNVVVGVSSSGDVVAIDPQTGAVRGRKSLGTTTPVLGATFDADGWMPSGQAEPIETVAALVSIARDRDARFDRVKELAVNALSKLPGPEVTAQLLAVLADNRAPQKLKDAVVELMMQRRDPSSLPVLTQQLAVHTSYIAQTEPEALGPVAKAIAGLGGMPLEATHVSGALAALQSHLDAPTTAVADLIQIINAMASIGGGAERHALASHMLLYHADDEIGGDVTWAKVVVAGLAKNGGPGERELLRQVGSDPRTRPPLADAIRDLLGSE
jgi:outer membrane protein assembly factor BamB